MKHKLTYPFIRRDSLYTYDLSVFISKCFKFLANYTFVYRVCNISKLAEEGVAVQVSGFDLTQMETRSYLMYGSMVMRI